MNEQQLDAALQFLATHGAKGNSFDYYDKRRAEWNGFTEYLFKYLNQQFGLSESESHILLNHLIADGYVAAVWEPPEGEKTGQQPNQIKITFKGLMRADSGRLSEMQKKENIKAQYDEITNLQKIVFSNQITEYQNKEKDYWRKVKTTILSNSIVAILAAALSAVPLLILNKEHEKIIVLPNIQIVHDTVSVIKVGTSLKKGKYSHKKP